MDNKTDIKVPAKVEGVEKGGFFKRVFGKIDQAMKDKADQAAAKGGCGCDDGKGGKCC